jgi:hypothetical protein
MDEVQRKKIMSVRMVFVLVRSLEYFELKERLNSLYCRLAIPAVNANLLNKNLEGFRDARWFTTGVTGQAPFKIPVEFFWARSKRQLLNCAVRCVESG